MKKKKRINIMRGLTSVTAALTAVLVAAISIVNVNASFINTRLGTTNVKYVDKSGKDANTTYFKSDYESVADVVDAKDALAESIAEEGTVLLKNNNDALPMAASEKVTLWGLNSHDPVLGGMIGSTAIVNEEAGQPIYNIEDAFKNKGIELNEDMITFYSSEEIQEYAGHPLTPSFGTTYENPSTYNVGEAPASAYPDAVLATADTTAAVVVISRNSSEAADYEPEMTTGTDDSYERPLALSTYEQEMIELAKAHSTKVVVLLNTNNPVEIESLKQDSDIDSILWVGEPGVNGFLGVADVLLGNANPSGHLTDTYAVNSTSSPAMANFGVYMYTNNSQSKASDALEENDKGDWFVVENENIYVGYKYYETRYEDTVLSQGKATDATGSTSGGAWDYASEVSYPFGYGLSYTTFEQKLDSVDVKVEDGEKSTASVTVTNTGDVAGKSVAELYVQAPYTEGGIEKSSIQLVGFAKTGELEPGASETVEVEFDAAYFASYDTESEKWVLDAGDYYFAIGNGAHDALNNVLAAKGTTDGIVSINETDTGVAENAMVWNLAEKDDETYSENVQNNLQDMDINNYIPDTVEYTTRSDWTKGWETISELTPTEEMMAGLTNSLYEINDNGDGVTWGADNGLTILEMMEVDDEGNYTGVVDFDDEKWDQLVDQITLDEAIQFIEKGGDDVENIDSILLVRNYSNDGPLGFAFDQVAGYSVRWQKSNSEEATYLDGTEDKATYSMATMPTEPMIAATFNLDLIQQEGDLYAEDALWANESCCIAPGMNIHRTPYCARNHEYYSEDAVLTAYCGNAFCEGTEAKGLMSEPKHFAFNHQESNRSGISTFMNEQGAREIELRGFEYVMENNNCSTVMTAFNRSGTSFVGADKDLLVNIARDEWGYTGAFVTDMINGADYMNWRDVVAGGGGNALTTSAYDTSEIGNMASHKNEIAKDTEFQEMMKYNIKFWLYNLAQSNAMNGISQNTEVVHILTWYQKALYGACAAFGVLTVLLIVLDIRGRKARG